jgi:biopolymer transport protein ExbD
MERQHKRGRRLPSFNLVALMDIFTILVFFLLVNSSDVEVLPNTKSLKLPESVANKKPEETLVVMVNNKDILVGGKKVASVQAVMASPTLVIQPLKAELDYQAKRSRVTTPEGTRANREITIMGDRNIPFELLKKVMVTCARASYTKISLAVLKKTLKKG